MQLTYHVHAHDGGWAYRLDDVWSETFPTHDKALGAAKQAARRQQVGGQDARSATRPKTGSGDGKA